MGPQKQSPKREEAVQALRPRKGKWRCRIRVRLPAAEERKLQLQGLPPEAKNLLKKILSSGIEREI